MTINDDGFLSPAISPWISKHRAADSKIFQIASDLNRVMVRMMRGAMPPKNDKRGVLVAVLFARSIEHFESAIVLAERGAIPSGRALLRVLCDATFAIRACAKKSEYVEKIILDDRIRERQLLDALVALPREDVAVPQGEMVNIEKRLGDLRASIKADGQSALKSIDTAFTAGLEDFYRLFYVPYSNAVHSAARDLDDHVVQDNDGDIKAFRWGPDSGKVEGVVSAAVQIAFAASNGHLIVFPNDSLATELENLWEEQKRYLNAHLERHSFAQTAR